MGASLVIYAWNHGNAPQHEGQGFWLKVFMRNGYVFRGPTHRPQTHTLYMDDWGLPSEERKTSVPTWISLDDVIACQVEW